MPYKNPADAKENKRRKWAAMTEEQRQAEYQRHKERRAANKQQSRQYQRDNYHKRMAVIIEAHGGKCVKCGSTTDLEFDHIDRTTKVAKVSTLVATSSLDNAIQEAKKCQLLCKECHINKTIENSEYLPR